MNTGTPSLAKPCDQAVAVGFVRLQKTLGLTMLGNQDRFGHIHLKKYNRTNSVTNF